jgi:guanylate kinase
VKILPLSEMADEKSKKGKLIVISGPSGVGKGTICAEVARRLSDVSISVSATTRPKAQTEVDGKDYRFVSPEQFQEMINEGKLLEYAEVFGNMYGTPKDEVDRALAQGRTIILEIDVQGGRSVKQRYPDAVLIFILPPDRKELARRLQNRGRDAVEATRHRLLSACDEIDEARKFYDNMVVNDNLEQAVRKVIGIIKGDIGGNECSKN